MLSPLIRENAVWTDVELLDSGDFEKCERYGDVILVRPEPQALWAKSNNEIWKKAWATYTRTGREGDWDIIRPLPPSWTVGWEDLTFRIRTTSFKHTGLFPEQASNWKYLRSIVKPGMKVMNLFGYTGGVSLAAASAGAEVVHVDGSKPAIAWVKENIELSGLGARTVRYITDDVMKYVAREVRRGSQYDCIIMDPPAFGRGPEGELWKFEEHLPKLLEMCASILNKEHGYLVVNAYSLGFPALAIENLVRTSVPFVRDISAAELTLKETTARGFELPTGIVIRASW